MKKILIAFLIAAMILSLVSCVQNGNDDEENKNPDENTEVVEPGEDNEKTDENADGDEVEEIPAFDFMAEDLTKYIKLGEYKGLKATKEDGTLSDEEFAEYVNDRILVYYSDYVHITDRMIEEGDTVVLDYTGSMDGKIFDGGTALAKEIVAGEGTGYIPGFASSLIGHMAGDQFAIDIAFPDPYPNNPDLSGKPVTFLFKIHYIKGEEIVPTLDTITDAFVKENFGYETLEEYITDEFNSVKMQKSYSMTEAMYNELFMQIFDASEVIEYPQSEFDRLYGGYRDMFEYYASYYGIDYDTYLSEYEQITDEDLKDEIYTMLKDKLVLYALVKDLDAEVTDAETSGKIAFFAEMLGVTADDIISSYGEASMREQAQFDKVLALVAKLGTIEEVSSTPAE